MNGRSRLVGMAAALAILGAACTATVKPVPPSPPLPSPSPVRIPGVPVGGTLKTEIVSDVSAAFDPQKEYHPLTFELFRCCLLRTILATNGRDAQHGGTVLHPDLAASLPTVSTDGLTWTFHLKPGIHYAPPLQDLTVTSADFIRALEREACPDCSTGGYAFYYSVIEGFEAAQQGLANGIVGLSAPNPTTLVVRLKQPTGDLGYRFSLAATAPIPPNPAYPDAPLGVASGHTGDYGRFVATTGPYMFKGQASLLYTANRDSETPISGYRPGQSITLVRNPSWKPATDHIRPAYVDEIDIGIGGTTDEVFQAIRMSSLDLNLDTGPTGHRIYSISPIPQESIDPTDRIRYLSFNLAVPPFDDVHVRKAVNYAIDKDGLRIIAGDPSVGSIATHVFPDSLETVGGQPLLAGFDPYGTRHEVGDLAKAKDEMKLSKYDSNGDGVCDAPACSRVFALTDFNDPYPGQAALIQHGLDGLGIKLQVKWCERICPLLWTGAAPCVDPASKMAFCLNPDWAKDYPDAFTSGQLFDSSGLYPDCCNASLLGAGRRLLRKYHYSVTSVPSVDADFDRCEPLTGDERVHCWADLDRKLMTEIVPWVPYLIENRVTLTSERLRNFTWDAFTGVASLDHLAVLGETTG